MSVPQEREEAAGPSETLSPESASHSCGTMKNDEDMYDPGSPTHSDGGTRSQTHRPPSPTPSSVSIKSNGSMHDPPTLDSGPAAQDKPDSVSIKRNGSMHDPPTLDSGQAAQPTPDVSIKRNGSMHDPPTLNSGPAAQDKPESQTYRPPSPTPSSVSMKSDGSMHDPPTLNSRPAAQDKPESQTYRPPSPTPSSVSMKSDGSMHDPPTLNSGPAAQDKPESQTYRPPSPTPSSVSMKSDGSMHDPPTLNSGPAAQDKPESQTYRPPSPTPSSASMKSDGSMHDPPTLNSGPAAQDKPDDLSTVQLMGGVHEQVLSDSINKNTGTEDLRGVIENHKASLRRKFENISEGIIKPGAETLLNKIYTELYITEGESKGVNKEHEVWQVESASRSQTTEDTPIKCNDIFKPLPGQKKHIRTVMTKGVAGIGKTVSVQKFILDWTDGVANQDVDFMFLLPFRELNLVRENQYSLHRLLLDFYPELKELKDSEEYNSCQVVLIFDGLDESRLKLDFQQTMLLSDLKQTSSVDVLMTSLIQGTLFPSALIWITSRPAAARQIPVQYVDLVTEVRGFNDPQKEEYFRKKISDGSQANKIISHIKASRSLHIMCHIPVFCWIAATVLEQLLKRNYTQEIPKTLTEMFIHFLLIQTTRKDQKYRSGDQVNKENFLESQKDILLKLAELAFKNLENGHLMFYDEDLRDCGIDVSEASESGMCTEIFKEESVFDQKKVYCFVHLSIQEFLAALFVFHSYMTDNVQALKFFISEEHRDGSSPSTGSFFRSVMGLHSQYYPNPSIISYLWSVLGLKSQDHLHVLLKNAVDKTLKRKKGHLDLFLRFLMGISIESNQILLQGLLNQIYSTSKSIKETCQYIKQLNREDLSPERCINLFHCLFEMNDQSMHKEVEKYLSSPNNTNKQELTPAHCSALAHILLMSEKVLDEFDLKKYNTSDEGHRRLIPAVRCCRKARLAGCKLTDKSCKILASVLQSQSSLIELDLSDNYLGDCKAQLLSKGLSSPNCKLQTLRLGGCKLTYKSSELLASFLQSPNSLIELDLSYNDLRDSGIQLLSKGLSSPHCKLQTLRLAACKVTNKSCEPVASVLLSVNSLIKLDLSENDLGDSGVLLLSKGLSSHDCKLQKLGLSGCLISLKGCGFLASALTSNSSHLKELDLSYNHPEESGLKLLSARLDELHCKLKTLKTDHCADIRLKPGLRKYAYELTLDPNTAHTGLSLFEGNRKVTWVREDQPYPDHPERFNWWYQVLCREGLSGRCYWEAECSGYGAHVAVAYKSIKRKGEGDDVRIGRNAKSWSLWCSLDSYSVWHNYKNTTIPAPSSRSRRVGVYLDWPAGTLSFYSVSSDTLTHLHTFHSTFTEPLYAGFWVYSDSSISLCQIQQIHYIAKSIGSPALTRT
ncbi:NACHT, LRR and PYD domains-containing protein 12-like isoform X2 [Alosa alosa]|uniref:NACHT, LRR and PYD domains-containing protein 12-like isoform X2 n=1 Tax=Alosa alosa TaxID=278164 RepID=UPI0020152E07|nr:NACHT, LRR and PYD domains-containing protein 12-like isoform X2 [Alosa alosa]